MRGTRFRLMRGFTMLELMIVLAMLMILMAIAVPNVQRQLRGARETALRQNLSILRSSIQEFTIDKKRAPGSLQDLVSEKYIREMPKDITGNRMSWREEVCDMFFSAEQSSGGLCDVYSGSEEMASDGTAYSSW